MDDSWALRTAKWHFHTEQQVLTKETNRFSKNQTSLTPLFTKTQTQVKHPLNITRTEEPDKSQQSTIDNLKINENPQNLMPHSNICLHQNIANNLPTIFDHRNSNTTNSHKEGNQIGPF